MFALRDDLASAGVPSEPYVLLKYRLPADGNWAMLAYQVLATDARYPSFTYNGTAGTPIFPPYPVRLLNGCDKTFGEGEPYWQDRVNQQYWAKSAGSVTVRYYYPLLLGWDYAANANLPSTFTGEQGDCVAWLDRANNGKPIDVDYTIAWPAEVPVLQVGETLLTAKRGLPDITNQAAVEVVFEGPGAGTVDAPGTLVQLIEPRVGEVEPLGHQANLRGEPVLRRLDVAAPLPSLSGDLLAQQLVLLVDVGPQPVALGADLLPQHLDPLVDVGPQAVAFLANVPAQVAPELGHLTAQVGPELDHLAAQVGPEREHTGGDTSAAEEISQATRLPASKPTVAVLPFENLNGDPSEDYLCDGITEDITTTLAKNRWLNVIARNPAFAFRGSKDSIRSIGQKLNADYIVTGTVRKAGSRFRITAQVVAAETEQSIWTERFDRDMSDIFELQDDISHNVACRIEAELGLEEQKKAERKPRKNAGAWDLYQLGVAEFYKFTPEGNRRSQELLRKSIELDPTLASA